MPTTTDICNIALSVIGSSLVTSQELHDKSTEVARLCHANYSIARDSILESRAWAFATKREILTCANPKSPESKELPYKYVLPPECLRVLRAYDQYTKWAVEGKNLYSEVANGAPITYIQRIEDPSYYPYQLLYAIAYKLASILVVPLSGKVSLIDKFSSLSMLYVNDASGSDGTQAKREETTASTLIDARYQ
jgi:hypothetical protein